MTFLPITLASLTSKENSNIKVRPATLLLSMQLIGYFQGMYCGHSERVDVFSGLCSVRSS
jgi:hypothetical protein